MQLSLIFYKTYLPKHFLSLSDFPTPHFLKTKIKMTVLYILSHPCYIMYIADCTCIMQSLSQSHPYKHLKL